MIPESGVAEPDLDDLKQAIETAWKPTKSFYPYGAANDYANRADPVLDRVLAAAAEPRAELLILIERALTLTVRAVLRSDTSSGLQGIQVHELMAAHARVACGLADSLTAKDRRRIVDWMIKFRYGGKQDYFDPDIVEYAPAVGPDGVERYRRAIEGMDLGKYGEQPLIRLAILDRDAEKIVQLHGTYPRNSFVLRGIVKDLDEAGLQDEALPYAEEGIRIDERGYDSSLINFVVAEAIKRDDHDRAIDQRFDWLRRFPTSKALLAFRETAQQLGRWEPYRIEAEGVLQVGYPKEYLRFLLDDARDDEAWEFAHDQPDAVDHGLWVTLCKRRRKTHPAESLPLFRELVRNTLQVSKPANYQAAARLLRDMRDTAKVADEVGPFQAFLAEVWAVNRRRPTLLDLLERYGLVPPRS